MSIGVIVPFRGLSLGKTRLRARLPAATVNWLSERMLANVLRSVRAALPEAPVVLMTQSRAGLAPLIRDDALVIEQPLDLNQSIEHARRELILRGAGRILVVTADLPLIDPVDVNALLAPTADVVIAPDAAEVGTNALVFPASAANFPRFGAESAERHAAEAGRRGLIVSHLRSASLSRDTDTVDQIDDAVRAACGIELGALLVSPQVRD